MDRAPNLNDLTEMEIIQRYRFDMNGILYLEQLIGNGITPKVNRNNAISARQKILITLRYLATGPIQLNDSDLHKVSQPTVSRVLTRVIDVLSSPDIVKQFIRFPTMDDQFRRNSLQFQGIARFPNVIGVIDGTHIGIKAPHEHEEVFVNRKGVHARWPGSVHDSRVLRESGLIELFEGGHANGYYLLGDSGYPAKRWLLTPYLAPQNATEEGYNRSHKITRALVERSIGQLKKMFGVLHGEINLEPQKVCKVIVACCVLHNICKERAIPINGDDDSDDEDDNADDQLAQGVQQPPNVAGNRFRDHVAATYFSNNSCFCCC
ncbi:putative nuclease HARBI1 isoform X1 [Mya arenaria]|uniref:putative nuclease HARBI1 isoform X1 n=1 Tax=Mya arenaria TaxID=6604 RepID=UPI0022E6DE3B|nr:putative nuclease HARBI1 isoform X1 [Mya arenaria]